MLPLDPDVVCFSKGPRKAVSVLWDVGLLRLKSWSTTRLRGRMTRLLTKLMYSSCIVTLTGPISRAPDSEAEN